MKKYYLIKKVSLVFLLVLAFSFTGTACNYKLKMYDTYGDGWNGGKVTVYVNSVAVLVDKTVSSGNGPISFVFSVSTGDQITTDYTSGSYNYENEYWILDAMGNEVASQGVGGSVPNDIINPISAFCPVSIDASIPELVQGCIGSKMVYAKLSNAGLNTLTSVSINWSLDGVVNPSILWTGSLPSNSTVLIPLDTLIGAFTVYCSAPNGGTDLNTSNDTVSKQILSNMPYIENWDNIATGNIPPGGLSNGWTCSSSSNPTWVVDMDGTPSSNTGPSYDHTLGTDAGNYVFLETSSSTSGDTSFLVSPCLSFSASVVAVKLGFYYHMYGTTIGTLAVQQYVGTTWSTIWSISGQQQSSSTEDYIRGVVALDPLAIKVRFAGVAGSSYTGDIAIDDVSFFLPASNDLNLLEWVTPVAGIFPNNSVPITVKILNKGLLPQDTFNINYSIDGGTTYVSELYTDTIFPDDTLTYTFASNADLSISGLYNCIATVQDPADSKPNNDTASVDLWVGNPLNGSYTIGAGSSNDFSSFHEAADALKYLGISGPVTILVDNGVYNEQVVFSSITGASITNTITFTSATGNPSSVVLTNNSTNTSDYFTLMLSGASFLRFQNITIKATNTVNSIAVKVANGSSSNIFYNNIIQSFGLDDNSNCLWDNDEINNFNTYRKNTVIGGNFGIYISGNSASSLQIGCMVDSNDINGFYSSGIYIENQDSIIVTDNYIHSSLGSAVVGIYAFSSFNDFKILRNKIVLSSTDYCFGIYVYNCNTSSYGPIMPNPSVNNIASSSSVVLSGLVANNMVSISGNGTNNGIYASDSEDILYYNNSVLVSGGGTSSFALHQSNSPYSSVGQSFINNIFVNTGGGYAAYFGDTLTPIAVDYNNYYTLGSKFVYWGNDIANISALKLSSSKDSNSVSVDPIYANSTNLHVNSMTLDGIGFPLSEVVIDFDGEPRDSTNPDIGADEYIYTPPLFEEQPLTNILGVYASSVAWGDYDSDGDLDIVISGDSANNAPVTKIYKNDGNNVFSWQSSISMTGVKSSSIDWGDYNNDGDIDLLLTGDNLGSAVSKLYKNIFGSSFVEQTGVSIVGVMNSSVAWGDYDNDGDLDILITGDSALYSPIAKVYKNNGNNIFTPQNGISLAGAQNSSALWADYDNDGDLDILLTSPSSSKIYKNNGNNTFTFQSGISLIGVENGDAAWGDYDNDGNLDLLLTGYCQALGKGVSKIYKNNGNNTFTDQSSITFAGVMNSSVAWGDYDNDGDLDLMLIGDTALNSPISRIYTNNGNNSFTELTASMLTAVSNGDVAWGDYDNDGDLDILLTGFCSAGMISKVYRNNGNISNSAPSSPTGLYAQTINDSIHFMWNASIDATTPSQALSYSLRVGSSLNSIDLKSPPSNLNTAYHTIVKMGDIQGTAYTMKIPTSLATNYIYWSVQAIDNSYLTSSFSTADSSIAPNATFTLSQGSFTSPPFNEVYTNTSIGHFQKWLWHFGDGDSSLLMNPNHAYAYNGIYQVRLIGYDTILNFKDTSYLNVFCNGGTNSSPSFEVTDSNLTTIPFYVAFTNTSVNYPSVKWTWDFADGSTSSAFSSAHTFAYNGIYLVKLYAADTVLNAVDSAFKTIVCTGGLNAPPTFTPSSTNLTSSPFLINFTNTSINSLNIKWLWQFGDGDSSLLHSPSHTYTFNGTYEVKLFAIDTVSSIVDTAFVTIVCSGGSNVPPSFTTSQTNLTSPPFYVSYTNTSTNNVNIKWLWKFGDGDSSLSFNSNHTYLYNGTYLVELLAIDTVANIVDTVSTTIICSGGVNNLPSFSASQTNFTAPPFNVVFTNTSINNSNIKWMWKFGDGDSSLSNNSSHTYAYNGVYEVELIANDTVANLSDTAFETIICNGGSNVPPAFTASQTSFTAPPFYVSFTNNSSNSLNIKWVWDFGDGDSSLQFNASHTYGYNGVYQVRLFAIDTVLSQVDTAFVTITCNGGVNLAPSFIATPMSFNAPPFNVTFTNTSQGSYTNWFWSFDDGSTSFAKNPSHSYFHNGNYMVTLFGIDSINNTLDTISKVIICAGGIPNPCSFTSELTQSQSNAMICFGDSVRLSATPNPNVSYLWTHNGAIVPGATDSVFYAKQQGFYMAFLSTATCSKMTSNYFVLANYPHSLPTISVIGSIAPCSDDSLILQATAGCNTYLWSTGETAQSIIVKKSGYFTVSTTGNNNCVATSQELIVNTSLAQIPKICAVSVNGVNNHNTISWQAETTLKIDSFRVYRETSISNQYDMIGSVAYNSSYQVEDINSNAAVRQYQYRITAVDTCGKESPTSLSHKTLHLIVNRAINNHWNLIWEAYRGFSFGSYNIYRGTDSLNMSLLTTISSNNTSYTDINNPSGDIFYQIEVVSNDPCQAKTNPISRSNSFNTANAVGFGASAKSDDGLSMMIYPNPNNGHFTLEINHKSNRQQDYILEVYTVVGGLVYQEQLSIGSSIHKQMYFETFNKGIYIVRLRSKNNVLTSRFIIE